MSLYDDLGYADPSSMGFQSSLGVSPLDMDRMVRTVYGEGANSGPLGQQAIASVILNRSRSSGQSPSDVVMAPHQFEPWQSRRDELEGLDPSSPTYQSIYSNIQPIISGQMPDPTGGATHFYSPKSQALLAMRDGRPLVPSWARGLQGTDIGGNRFFKVGYGGGAAPAPALPVTADDAMMQAPAPTDQPAADDTPLARFMQIWQALKGKGGNAPMQAMALAPASPALAAPSPGGSSSYAETPAAPASAPQPVTDATTVPGITTDQSPTMSDQPMRLAPPANAPAPAPASAPVQAGAGGAGVTPEMMRMLMGGAYGSPLSSILAKLSAGFGYGATHGLGAGLGMAAQGVGDTVDEYRKGQMEMAPKMLAYNALVKQGLPPDQALLQAFAPGSLGKWNPHQMGTDNMGNPIWVVTNDLTGESRGMTDEEKKKLGVGSGGISNIPDTLVGPDRLKAIQEEDPAFASLMQQGLAGQFNPYKEGRFVRTPQLMTNYMHQMDLATRDPNNPTEIGDYDPEKMLAARQQYAELSDMKPTSPGGILRGFDQAATHFSQAVQAYDRVNQGKYAPLDSGSWGPATSLFNRGILDWSKLNADPDAQAKLPPVAAAAYELAKAFRGSGTMSDAAAADFMAQFKLSMSPQEQKSTFANIAKLTQGAYDSYYNKYQQLPASFRKRYPFPVQFSPEGLSLFKRFGVRPAGVDDKTWEGTQALGQQAPKIQIQPGEKVTYDKAGNQYVQRGGNWTNIMTGEVYK